MENQCLSRMPLLGILRSGRIPGQCPGGKLTFLSPLSTFPVSRNWCRSFEAPSNPVFPLGVLRFLVVRWHSNHYGDDSMFSGRLFPSLGVRRRAVLQIGGRTRLVRTCLQRPRANTILVQKRIEPESLRAASPVGTGWLPWWSIGRRSIDAGSPFRATGILPCTVCLNEHGPVTAPRRGRE
jgi:hypothetical protein